MSTQQTFEFLDVPKLDVPKLDVPKLDVTGGVQAKVPESGGAPSRQDTKDTKSSLQHLGDLSLGDLARNPDSPLPPPPDSSPSPPRDPRAETLRRLRAQMEGAGVASADASETLSTGCSVIDDWLPRGGLRGDAISEWVNEGEGGGGATLSLISAAIRLSQTHLSGGPLVVVSGPASGRRASFYPPAAVALGIPMQRLIWVQPKRRADLVWAVDQALRCPAVAAVWAEIGSGLDDRDARRFQLAAETGGTPGLFVRPASVRGRASFADIRFHVATENPNFTGNDFNDSDPVAGSARMMRVTLDRCRGGTSGQQVLIRVDDRAHVHALQLPSKKLASHETTVLPLAAELAHPKSPSRANDRRRA